MQTLNQSSIRSGERRIADVMKKLPYQLRQVRVRQIPILSIANQRAPPIASMENPRADALNALGRS
jgi:hypothetical protein